MSEAPGAARLLETLVASGATHFIGVPDNGSARLFEVAAATATVDTLTVSREGEAIAVASGLWLGGATPVVVVQNTGLLESGDSLRGTAFRMGAPLLLLVGVRGHAKMTAHAADIESARAAGGLADVLKRADVDSVALLTVPTLNAWQVPHYVYDDDDDADVVGTAWERARSEERPVAVLLPRALR